MNEGLIIVDKANNVSVTCWWVSFLTTQYTVNLSHIV